MNDETTELARIFKVVIPHFASILAMDMAAEGDKTVVTVVTKPPKKPRFRVIEGGRAP